MKHFFLFFLLFTTPLLVFADPLPASEVFQFTTKPADPNTLMLNWHIKPGYFLYKNRIHLVEQPNSNLHIGSIPLPTSLTKTDKQGHTYMIYRNQLVLPLAILGQEPGESLLDVHFQGCSDEGFCYPPQTMQIKLSIDDTLGLTSANLEPLSTNPGLNHQPIAKQDKIDQLFSDNAWPLIILSFFGFGLLLSFTPCVLPMVPVLSGIIVGHGHNISTRKAFLLSLTYVLSMSATYGIVGAVIALMGNNLQIIMQAPWAISLFGLIFVLLALSMFNVYELRLPVSWQSKFATITRSQSSGHYLSAAIMGCMSTLILSPCVTAPMIGALGYIARTGNMFLGLFSLFFLGLGMGTPLLLIGASAGKVLPKAGRWMNDVKAIFGVLLLATAIDLTGRILPPILTMGLWASLLVFCGIYSGALQKANSNQEKFKQGVGIILLVYGLLVLVGASQGNSNPLQPLKPLDQIRNTPTIIVNTVPEAIEALSAAKGKLVMLEFYADWCASCKVLEATTLQDSRVTTALHDFIVIKIDLSQNNAKTHELLNYFHVVAPPTFLFYNKLGDELTHLRLVGETSAKTFFERLKQV